MSLGPTAEPNLQVTGKVLPGIVKTGQLPRKAESLSVSKVADITTTLSGPDRLLVLLSGLEKVFFSRPRRISCNKYQMRVILPVDLSLVLWSILLMQGSKQKHKSAIWDIQF